MEREHKKEHDDYTIGYVNSLHIDLCDLIKHNLVSVFMERFIDEIKSCKKYSKSMKEKVIKKPKRYI